MLRTPTVVLTACSLALVLAMGFTPARQAASGSKLVTLYAHDDLLSSFSFRSGAPGGRIVDGEVDLAGAQVVYHRLAENMLTFGFAHDELVSAIDLGPYTVLPVGLATDDAAKFPVSIFHTLYLDGTQFAYRASTNSIRLREADDIRGVMRAGITHLAPQVGNTYLVRYRSRGGERTEGLAKFQIVDVRPGESLTLRWAPVPAD